MGTPAQELTPRLPISVESRGIPARAVEGADIEDGADDAALLEPEPHMPDDPAVANIAEVVDDPEVADAPNAAPVPGVAVAIADAVAGGAVPFRPPPS